MNYGSHGRVLLSELSKAQHDNLPKYNEEAVLGALQDLTLHVQALHDQVSAASAADKPPIQLRPNLLLQHAAIHRNKRCLLAYHVERMRRIQRCMYWDTSESTEALQAKLAPAEQDFLQEYIELVQQYSTSTLGDVDAIRRFSDCPVQQDRVTVRCVQVPTDLTTEVLESGQLVTWSLHAIYHVLYQDVQEYIQKGFLQLLLQEDEANAS